MNNSQKPLKKHKNIVNPIQCNKIHFIQTQKAREQSSKYRTEIINLCAKIKTWAPLKKNKMSTKINKWQKTIKMKSDKIEMEIKLKCFGKNKPKKQKTTTKIETTTRKKQKQ